MRLKTAIQHVTKEADEKVNENKFQTETQVRGQDNVLPNNYFNKLG